MIIQLPERVFYSVDELTRIWSVELCDVWECLMAGDLIGHVRVPLVCAFLLRQDGNCIQKSVTTWEGYALVTRYQCQRFYEHGQLALREFSCAQIGERFVLPDEADDLVITAKRFGVLKQERERFEAVHGVFEPKEQISFDPSFRTIVYQGKEYYFGGMQAAVLKRLFEAACTDQPWLSGKALLHEVGSESFNLMALFKKHPIGKELIVSDRRGLYRIASQLL